MRKKAILLALSIVIVIGCVAGSIAYAATSHNPPSGAKLVGVGWSTYPSNSPANDFWTFSTMFDITNPNCDTAIDIKWMSILDMDGNSVFEGAPGTYHDYMMNTDTLVLPAKLNPHQIWQFQLRQYLESVTPFQWESDSLLSHYTVEITWSGRVPRPLTGFAKGYIEHLQQDNVGTTTLHDVEGYEVQMINYSR